MIKHAHDPKSELHRPLEVARVATLGSHEKISADARECIALAKRFQVPKIHAVSAELKAKSWRGGGMKISGQAFIDLDQESVVSLEVFRSQTTIPVERYFLNIPAGEDNESEQDIDPIVNGVIDLGEVIAETIALELDPYPRMPGEAFEAIIEDDPADDEKPPNPFNVLKLRPDKP
jgi:uncharacterized metal-binding protein YceD (DUF177 family)